MTEVPMISICITNLRELLVILDDTLDDLEATRDAIPGFAERSDALDLEGRLQRLHRVWQTLDRRYGDGFCDAVHDTLQPFLAFFQRLQALQKTLHTRRVAGSEQWQRWWDTSHDTSSSDTTDPITKRSPIVSKGGSRGKYAYQLLQLGDDLNSLIADHVFALTIHLPEEDDDDADVGDHGNSSDEEVFPPTLEQMKLTKPSSFGANTSRFSFSSQGMMFLPPGTKVLSTSSTRSTATAGTCASTESEGSQAPMDQPHTESAAPVSPMHWDFSPRLNSKGTTNTDPNKTQSRRERMEIYLKTQALRDPGINPNTPVKELRIVLAQLEAGDTSQAITNAKAIMMTVGMLNAIGAMTFQGVSASDALWQSPLEAAAVLTHYLLEFTLEDGTIGTLENCLHDIYLYAGRTPRRDRHCVCTIPMRPGSPGAPVSLSTTRPLLLHDLIRYRNEQRQLPYRLMDNNCKHFVFQALTEGDLFPAAENLVENMTMKTFFDTCQSRYAQEATFDMFSSASFLGPSSHSCLEIISLSEGSASEGEVEKEQELACMTLLEISTIDK